MARQIGPIVEKLMRRVRQEGGLAVSPDFATQIYSYCEQLTNTKTQRVISTTDLTTPKEKLLFHYRTEISDAIDILTIRESGRRIERAQSLMALSAYDITWFRSITGTRFEAWHQVGRDILILYPGQTAISSVSIEYVKLLTFHDDFNASYNEDSELPDEDVELALKLSEIILLANLRQLEAAKSLIEGFVNKYGGLK
jgi:hypothetical protein